MLTLQPIRSKTVRGEHYDYGRRVAGKGTELVNGIIKVYRRNNANPEENIDIFKQYIEGLYNNDNMPKKDKIDEILRKLNEDVINNATNIKSRLNTNYDTLNRTITKRRNDRDFMEIREVVLNLLAGKDTDVFVLTGEPPRHGKTRSKKAPTRPKKSTAKKRSPKSKVSNWVNYPQESLDPDSAKDNCEKQLGALGDLTKGMRISHENKTNITAMAKELLRTIVRDLNVSGWRPFLISNKAPNAQNESSIFGCAKKFILATFSGEYRNNYFCKDIEYILQRLTGFQYNNFRFKITSAAKGQQQSRSRGRLNIPLQMSNNQIFDFNDIIDSYTDFNDIYKLYIFNNLAHSPEVNRTTQIRILEYILGSPNVERSYKVNPADYNWSKIAYELNNMDFVTIGSRGKFNVECAGDAVNCDPIDLDSNYDASINEATRMFGSLILLILLVIVIYTTYKRKETANPTSEKQELFDEVFAGIVTEYRTRSSLETIQRLNIENLSILKVDVGTSHGDYTIEDVKDVLYEAQNHAKFLIQTEDIKTDLENNISIENINDLSGAKETILLMLEHISSDAVEQFRRGLFSFDGDYESDVKNIIDEYKNNIENFPERADIDSIIRINNIFLNQLVEKMNEKNMKINELTTDIEDLKNKLKKLKDRLEKISTDQTPIIERLKEIIPKVTIDKLDELEYVLRQVGNEFGIDGGITDFIEKITGIIEELKGDIGGKTLLESIDILKEEKLKYEELTRIVNDNMYKNFDIDTLENNVRALLDSVGRDETLFELAGRLLEEVNRLNNLREMAEKNTMEYEEKIMRQSGKISTLNDQLKIMEERIKDLQSTGENKSMEIEELQAKLKEAQSRLNQMKGDDASKEQLLEEYQHTIHELKERIKDLQSTGENKSMEIEEQKTIIRQLHDNIQELEENLQLANEGKEEMLAKLRVAEENFRKSQNETSNRLKRRVKKYNKLTRSKMAEIEDLKRTIEKLKTEKNAELAKLRQILEQNDEDLQKSLNKANQELERTIKDRNKTSDMLKRRVKKYNKLTRSKMVEIEDLKMTIEEHNAVHKAHETLIKERDSTIAELESQNKGYIQKMLEVSNAFDEVEKNLKSVLELKEKEIQDLQNENSGLQSALKLSAEQLAESQSRADDLDSKLKTQLEQYTQQLKNLNNTIKNLQEQLKSSVKFEAAPEKTWAVKAPNTYGYIGFGGRRFPKMAPKQCCYGRLGW